jgi:hypothetical protein
VVPDSEVPKATTSIPNPLCEIAKCQLCEVARTAVPDLREAVRRLTGLRDVSRRFKEPGMRQAAVAGYLFYIDSYSFLNSYHIILTPEQLSRHSDRSYDNSYMIIRMIIRMINRMIIRNRSYDNSYQTFLVILLHCWSTDPYCDCPSTVCTAQGRGQ